MNIEICKDNENKINEAIKQEQGRARTMILDYSIVESLIDKAEEHLKRENIEDGTNFEYEYTINQKDSVSIRPSKKANTYCRIKKSSKGKWFLIDIRRMKLSYVSDNLQYLIDYALEKSIKCANYSMMNDYFITQIRSNTIWSDDEKIKDFQVEWFEKYLNIRVPTETFEAYINNYIEEFPEKFI